MEAKAKGRRGGAHYRKKRVELVGIQLLWTFHLNSSNSTARRFIPHHPQGEKVWALL